MMLKDKVFIALNVSVFLLMVGVGLMVPLLPGKVIATSGDIRATGYLASMFAVAYVLLQVPVGAMADRRGFKGFLLAGYGICGLTGLLYYFSDATGIILVGRMLQGAGEVPLWALAPALLAARYPGQKGRAMGIYNAAIHLGLTLGGVFGLLVVPSMGPGAPFLIYAFTALSGGAIVFRYVENPVRKRRHAPDEGGGRDIRFLLGNPLTLAVLLGILLYGGGYGLVLTIIPGVLIAIEGFSQQGVGLFFTLFYVAVSLAQVIGGGFSDRFGQRGVMVSGLLAAAGGIGSFMVLEGPWKLAFLAFASLGLGLFHVASLAFLNDAVPAARRGAVSGGYYLFWGAGFFAFPLAGGKAGQVGFDLFFAGYAVFLIAAALAVAATGGRRYARV